MRYLLRRGGHPDVLEASFLRSQAFILVKKRQIGEVQWHEKDVGEPRRPYLWHAVT